jgi:predicted dehydrogenase
MMQTIHFLDILLWCLGRVESVTARVDAIVLKRDVEETGLAVLRFRSRVVIGSVVSTEDGRYATVVVRAMYESSETGRTTLVR